MRNLRHFRPMELGLVVLSVLVAAVCVRLCVWQLHRLAERRAHNALVIARLSAPPVTSDRLPRDSAAQHYLRIAVHGAYDYTHAIVLTGRSRNGSPGVNLITPVRITGTDTAMLVNRGWIYAADGANANTEPWREGDSVNAIGYVTPFTVHRTGVSKLPEHPHAYRWLDTAVARNAFPYPVRPYVVVLQGDTVTVRGGILPRVPAPPLDEGPHMSYAFQWAAFATIALVGALLFVRHRSTRDDDTFSE